MSLKITQYKLVIFNRSQSLGNLDGVSKNTSSSHVVTGTNKEKKKCVLAKGVKTISIKS
jgi:hypothetical protein